MLPVNGRIQMKPSAVIGNKHIYTHVTVVYTDNLTEHFEAIQDTEKGIIIGRIIQNDQGKNEFVQFGFIAHSMVQQIILHSQPDNPSKSI